MFEPVKLIHGYFSLASEDSQDEQVAKIYEWVDANRDRYPDHHLVLAGEEQIFVDDAGGRFFDREAARVLITRIRHGDLVVCPSLHSAFRDAEDFRKTFNNLYPIGLGFVFIEEDIDTNTPSGWRWVDELTLAHKERVEKAREVRREQQEKKATTNGAVTKRGACPIGWRIEGRGAKAHFVEHQPDRDLSARVVAMREEGLAWERIYWLLRQEKVRLWREPNKSPSVWTLKQAIVPAAEAGFPCHGRAWRGKQAAS